MDQIARKGNATSAPLYIPADATPQIPTPGILAVHGYVNSRETEDGFAIAFARGHVVLALDQTRYGYSDLPAFANGFGAPDGLVISAASSLPGALICGLFVTWYVVAGTATQAAF